MSSDENQGQPPTSTKIPTETTSAKTTRLDTQTETEQETTSQPRVLEAVVQVNRAPVGVSIPIFVKMAPHEPGDHPISITANGEEIYSEIRDLQERSESFFVRPELNDRDTVSLAVNGEPAGTVTLLEPNHEWRIFGRNARKNAYNPRTTPPLGDDVSIQWTRDPPDKYWSGTPLLVNDTLIGVTGRGGNGHGIYALDPATGETQWSRSVPWIVSASICATDQLVIYHSSDLNAIRLDSGEQVWTKDIDMRPYTEFVQHEETVYVPDGNSVKALSIRDGSQNWSQTHDRLEGDTIRPLAFDGDDLVGVAGREVVNLSGSDGNLRWRQRLASCESYELSTPLLTDEAIYIGTYEDIHSESEECNGGDRALYCLDRASGEVQWRASVPGVDSPIDYRDGVLQVMESGIDDYVWGFGEPDTSLIVEKETGSAGEVERSTPGMAAGALGMEVLIEATNDGTYIRAYQRSSDPVWEVSAPFSNLDQHGLIISDGRVFATGSEQMVAIA